MMIGRFMRIPVLRQVAFFFFMCLFTARAAAQPIAAPGEGAEPLPADRFIEENTAFRVEVPIASKALGPALLSQATQARGMILRRADVSFPHQTRIVWCESEAQFLEETGHRPENIIAAASARRGLIWINGPAWRRADPREALPVLAHEYAHIVVGRLSPAPLPRWADEGLAMQLSGQWTLGDSWAATRAQLFGGLPPLHTIENQFPRDGENLRRAYLASFLAIEQLALRMGGRKDNVTPILERLRDPQRGKPFVDSLRMPEVIAELEAGIRGALGSTARKWIIYLTSGTTLWMFITALFLYGYWKKRRTTQAAQRREQAEEPWTQSLTQDDIVEIYGEPQDTFSEADEDEPWKTRRDDSENP